MSGQDLDLMAALLAHLKADAGLQALLGNPARIWDRPPPGAGVPYLTLEGGRSRALPGATGAFEHELQLVCTSRFKGTEEVRAVIAAARLAMDGVVLMGDGLAVPVLEPGAARVAVSSDAAVTSGRLTLRAVTEKI